MDCNKDEAIRAKDLAEKEFLAKDIAAAKKLALKAQSLYPELEDISRMLATFDIHMSIENRVNGEADWYGILGASPGDDDETLRKKYRKLALLLHPDKNKCVDTEGAFKHISEAWKFLSDKAKRVKRTARAYYKFPTSSTGASFAKPGSNGVYQFAKTNFSMDNKTPTNSTQKTAHPTTTPVQLNSQNTEHNTTNGISSSKREIYSTIPDLVHAQRACNLGVHGSPNVPRAGHSVIPGRSHTFWTVCRPCMMQYEYPKICINRYLMCPNCCKTFLAFQVPPPGASNCWKSSRTKQSLNGKIATENKSSSEKENETFINVTPDSYAKTNQTPSKDRITFHAASMEQIYEEVKEAHEEAQTNKKAEDAVQNKNAETMSSCAVGSAAKRRKVMEDARIGSHGTKFTYWIVGGTGGRLYGIKEYSFETGEVSEISA